MGLFNRKNRQPAVEEQRSVTSLPWEMYGPSSSNVTPESAASIVPVFASMRILSENIATLPIDAYRNVGGKLTPQSYVPPLFYSPAVRDNIVQWVSKCLVSLALRGNAYGVITQRDQLGFPTQVEWLHPDDVHVDESSSVKPVYYYQGHQVDTSDVVHIPWIVMPGRVVGMSPVQAFAATMGIGLHATEYGKRWFENGGLPPATVKNNAKTVGPDEATEIGARMGKSIRSGRPLVLGKDWDFEAIPVNPNESQFIETMKLNATQIAAIYGVPPTAVGGELGGSLTYSTDEQQTNSLITLTLRPWMIRLETAFSALLSPNEEVRFNPDAMIRTSIQDRYENHNLALEGGWMNVDEVRAKENLPPLPNGAGQVYRIPGAASATPSPDEGVTE